MAVHELKSTQILRLEPGKTAVRWSDAAQTPEQKMAFRVAVGKLEGAIREELGKN